MIGVSILAAGQGDLCRQLADKDKGKRWLGVDAGRTRAGAIFIRDAALSLECAVHAQYPAGDHGIILLEIATFIAAAESDPLRSEEHTSELQSLMRISYAVLCLKKKTLIHLPKTVINTNNKTTRQQQTR